MSIIGAATSGLIAAKRLAGHGIDTTVYDQKVALGMPVVASGILSISGLEAIGIDPSRSMTNTLYGANIHSGTKTMKVVSEKPMAYVLHRQMLNEQLSDDAKKAGAVVVTGKRISAHELEGMRQSGLIIGADGTVSTVARHFGLGKVNGTVLTYKAEYDVDIQEPGMVDLFFDNVKYRGLFAWLCPNTKDTLEVGVGVDSRYGNAKSAFETFVKEPEVISMIGGRKPISHGASIIPIGLRQRFADDKNGVLLVGDAAGQVKSTTGGGIIFGGKGAILASRTVNDYFGGKAMLSDYEREFRKSYGLDLRLHSLISTIYNSMSPASMGIMLSALNLFGIDRFLAQYGDMDRPSLVAKRFFLRSLA